MAKKGLGKGLNSLFNEEDIEEQKPPTTSF